MSYLQDLLDTLDTKKELPVKRCPVCGGVLKAYLWGEPTGEIEEKIARKKLPIIIGGCMCYGDERDAESYCPVCNADYNEQLEKMEFISCPLEASGSILKQECRNYALLERKEHYQLLKNRELICNVLCPAIDHFVRITTSSGETFEGRFFRTFAYPDDDNLELEIKNGEEHSSYKTIYLRDIRDVRNLDN